MDLLQEYKDLYYKELETKNELNGKMGTSLTLLTIIATGHFFIWDNMVELSIVFHIIPILFLLLEVTAIISSLCSCYYFYKTYYKYDYRFVSIEKLKKSVDRNLSLFSTYTKKQIWKANVDMFCDSFYENAVHNRKLNITKSKNQLNLNICMIISFILLGLTYVMWRFVISQFTF